MYANLITRLAGAGPGSQIDTLLQGRQLRRAAGANVERTYSPARRRHDRARRTTASRTSTATTRDGTMFGAGYASAEDRLFFMDVLRHAGRGKLSVVRRRRQRRHGPRRLGRRALHRGRPPAPDRALADEVYGAEARQLQRRRRALRRRDQPVHRRGPARTRPQMPGEYAALGQPAGPRPVQVTDVISTAALVGGIFGKGGGGEVGSALVLEEAQRAVRRRARASASGATSAAPRTPRPPTTVHGRRFPYQRPRRNQGVALPDAGAARSTAPRRGASALAPGGAAAGRQPARPARLTGERRRSNALLVSGARDARRAARSPCSARRSPTSRRRSCMEQRRRAGARAIDARGVGVPGLSLYVLLGRGRDYAWSATSAGQDIIDTFALPLCEPDGSRPTHALDALPLPGALPAVRGPRPATTAWAPTSADDPGRLPDAASLRTKLGIVAAPGPRRRQPVRLRASCARPTSTRSTRRSASRASTTPTGSTARASFQRAARHIDYTFNWFYIDRHAHRLLQLRREPGPRTRAPTRTSRCRRGYEWRDYNPRTARPRIDALPHQHPQVIDQHYITSWNNKQAPGFRAADDNFNYGSTYRSTTLDRAIRRRIRGPRRVNVRQVIDATAEAATIDLRSLTVLPHALAVIRTAPIRNAKLRRAVRRLAAWARAGSHRIDRNGDGAYEHSAAIRMLDAWWEPLMRAEFQPTLGPELYEALTNIIVIDDPPNLHLGSAYNGGMYVYANKDLRMVLNRRVRGPFSRTYCGRGSLGALPPRALADPAAAPWTPTPTPAPTHARPATRRCATTRFASARPAGSPSPRSPGRTARRSSRRCKSGGGWGARAEGRRPRRAGPVAGSRPGTSAQACPVPDPAPPARGADHARRPRPTPR